MSIFDYYPDIPKPAKPLKGDTKKVRITPSNATGSEAFNLLQKRVNYLTEMMKFFPDFERDEYAGKTRDDLEEGGSWDEYGTLATTDAEEALPGHYGNVKRDTSPEGLPLGYGVGARYEEVDLAPTAGKWQHIDQKKAEISNADYFQAEDASLSTISPELWKEVKDRLGTETRSYYEIAMDDDGTLAGYTNKDAYLLMVGMLESRTRVWLTMEELFGKFDEQDDAKRIAIIDAWVSAAEKDLDPQNITLLSLFLDSQESFTNRISAFYGAGTEAYTSYEDKVRIPTFYESLSKKIAAYRQELVSAGKTAQVQELDSTWGLWIAPAKDPNAYPSYSGSDWATTPGNVLVQEDGSTSRQVVDQTKGLLASEYKTSSDLTVPIRRPDGSIIEANPYDSIWGTHIRGIFQRLIDTYISQNLIVSITNRRKVKEYITKEEEYENKIWDEKVWEKQMDKIEAKHKQEQAKQNEKVKESNKKTEAESKKMLAQAIAKKRAEKKNQAKQIQSRIKIHGQEYMKALGKLTQQSKKASKLQQTRQAQQLQARRKQAAQRIFGETQKKLQASSQQRTKKFTAAQAQRTSQRRSVAARQSEQTRSKIKRKNNG